ncbi:MAG: glutathione S-transferase family protein [Gammaproteobacteria bacterium]
MGMLVDGQWHDQWYDTSASGGRFVRADAQFRNWITPDGSAGPSGVGDFPAAAGRYHLYVGHACPWAHRTILFRLLKGLGDMISLSVVHWYMAEQGWTFAAGEGVIPDPIHHADYLHQVYTAAVPDYSGRVTIPVLWDKQRQTIVSNESSEIIRMFNSAFDALGATAADYYPQDLRAEIDGVNARVYETVNNGVYRAGFATTQEAYDEAVEALFETLDWLERRLVGQRYLCGDRLTEADWRLFTTLVRFDAVYHYHFKCNLARIRDYPNLHALVQRLHAAPDVAETVHMDHIKGHYYGSHKTINPTGIIPRGPREPL